MRYSDRGHPRHRRICATIDQTVANLNAFVVSLNRYLPYAPQIVGVQTRARSLRLSLMQLRQEAATGATPQALQARLGEVNRLLQALTATWQQTVSATRLASAPDLRDITLAIQQLNQMCSAGDVIR